MKNKKIVFAFVFLILIVIIFSNLLKKAFIFREYCKKNEQYNIEIDNFYKKIKDNLSETEIWRKGEKAISKNIKNDNVEIKYYDGDYMWIINDKDVTKIEMKILPTVNSCPLYVSNIFESLILSCMLNIEDENINGKECYKIYIDESSLFYKVLIKFGYRITDYQLYIDKDTWLLVKNISSSNGIQDIESIFNKTSDDDIVMPDLEGLVLIDNTY